MLQRVCSAAARQVCTRRRLPADQQAGSITPTQASLDLLQAELVVVGMDKDAADLAMRCEGAVWFYVFPRGANGDFLMMRTTPPWRADREAAGLLER